MATNKYWLVFEGDTGNREGCNPYYSKLIICGSRRKAIEIFLRDAKIIKSDCAVDDSIIDKYDEELYDYKNEDEDEDPFLVDAIELKPLTIDSVTNKKNIKSKIKPSKISSKKKT
jgi:hypothetical protein